VQAGALEALQGFFVACVARGLGGVFDLSPLVASLCAAAGAADAAGGGLANCASCLAALMAAAPPAARGPFAAMFLGLATGVTPPGDTGKRGQKAARLGAGAGGGLAAAPPEELPVSPTFARTVVALLTRREDLLASYPWALEPLLAVGGGGGGGGGGEEGRRAAVEALGGAVASHLAALAPLLRALEAASSSSLSSAAAAAAGEGGAGAGAGGGGGGMEVDGGGGGGDGGGGGAGASVAPSGAAYSILCAVRVVATRHALPGSALVAHLPSLLSALTGARVFTGANEGVRSVAAEVVGRLAAVHPALVLPRIVELGRSGCGGEEGGGEGGALRRAGAALALRGALHAAAAPGCGALAEALAAPGMLLALFAPLGDGAATAPRVAALHALRTLARTFPVLAAGAMYRVEAGRFPAPPREKPAKGAPPAPPPPLPDIAREGLLAGLFHALLRRPDMVREIPMGTYVHEQDDSLAMRKAAAEALAACLAHVAGAPWGDSAAGAAVLAGLAGEKEEELVVLAHQAMKRGGEARGRPLAAMLAAGGAPALAAILAPLVAKLEGYRKWAAARAAPAPPPAAGAAGGAAGAGAAEPTDAKKPAERAAAMVKLLRANAPGDAWVAAGGPAAVSKAEGLGFRME
jgi:hypothetical protein